MEQELDKLVDAAIEEAFIQQREQYNYEDEVADVGEYCCDECQGQAVYFLKR
jgi:hypothetical protein